MAPGEKWRKMKHRVLTNENLGATRKTFRETKFQNWRENAQGGVLITILLRVNKYFVKSFYTKSIYEIKS